MRLVLLKLWLKERKGERQLVVHCSIMTCNEPSSYPMVIFYPNNAICEHGYLCGEVISDDLFKTKNYFVHEVLSDTSVLPEDVIGVIGDMSLKKRKIKKLDWITLKSHEKLPMVVEVISNNLNFTREDCQIVVYNQSHFLQSELLVVTDCGRKSGEDVVDDHFKRLIFSLKQRQSLQKHSNGLKPLTRLILVKLISILNNIDEAITFFLFVFKFSTLALHISAFVKNAQKCLELMHRRKSFTSLVSGNYILGLVGDWFGGLLLIYWIMSLVDIEDVLQMLAVYSEMVVVSLKDMVRYLMGSPADLKLNGPLNNVLGKFFLFHIDLWWAFLGYSRPLLELGFQAFVCLGCLGLSFQIAILADLLAIASFHVYIIYVYAARLYRAQLTGLVSLSRVFLGRKRNPVPGRVDSCPYTTEQLLIGTISFTVLLFLLPTTLVYYVVFTAIRLVLIAAGGLLTQVRFILSCLPLYSTLLWLLDSPATTSSVRLSPKAVLGDEFVLVAAPTQGSWWRTVKACVVADLVPPPSPPPWGSLLWNLATGRLIYPV